MAQLYFYHAAMNSGKSTQLLQVAYNYKERGMTTKIITAGLDNRYGVGKVTSRIGIASAASVFHPETDMIDLVLGDFTANVYDCILIDEAQFLTRKQVEQLAELVDKHNVPVMCYGLRACSKMELFEGSAALFALADKLVELKGICHCGRKATQNARMSIHGLMVLDGPQVDIGGNDKYVSMCRKHFMEAKEQALTIGLSSV